MSYNSIGNVAEISYCIHHAIHVNAFLKFEPLFILSFIFNSPKWVCFRETSPISFEVKQMTPLFDEYFMSFPSNFFHKSHLLRNSRFCDKQSYPFYSSLSLQDFVHVPHAWNITHCSPIAIYSRIIH